MKETTKTTCFVAAAAVLGLVALVNSQLSQPSGGADSTRVGQAFYEAFDSTESARALKVAAVDAESGTPVQFSVENVDGLWRIPSHFNYPAEAAARIAETTSSVLGLKREALVGRGKDEFEKFGVIDPLAEDLDDPDNAGKRLTLRDKNDDIIADYIIGKRIEPDGPSSPGDDVFEQRNAKPDYFLRRADENETYRVAMDVDLTTEFSDWIDPDLLRVNRPEVTRIAINNYEVREQGADQFGVSRLVMNQKDKFVIDRETAGDPWKVDGMDEAKEEAQDDRIGEILGVLDELKIVGVRPKFKYNDKILLTPDLKLADLPELKDDPEKQGLAIRSLQRDLMEKGFNFGGTQQNLELVSENGELSMGTADGVLYRLHVGGEAKTEDKAIKVGGEPEEETESGDDDPAAAKGDDADRFLFVRVQFDESLLGGPPVKPVAPVKPEQPDGYLPDVEGEEENPDTMKNDKDAGDAESDADADTQNDEDSKSDDKPQRDPSFIEYEEALVMYEAAQNEYELGLTRFEQDKKDFAEKVENGKKKVKELNERFGDWYYVVAGDNLQTIQSQRTDVLKIKAPPAPPAGAPMGIPGVMPAQPNTGFPNLDGLKPSGKSMPKPADEAKSDEAKSDEAKPNDPKSGDAAEQPKSTEPKEKDGAKQAVEEKTESKTEGKTEESSPAEKGTDEPDNAGDAEPSGDDKPAESSTPEKSDDDSGT